MLFVRKLNSVKTSAVAVGLRSCPEVLIISALSIGTAGNQYVGARARTDGGSGGFDTVKAR